MPFTFTGFLGGYVEMVMTWDQPPLLLGLCPFWALMLRLHDSSWLWSFPLPVHTGNILSLQD